MFAIKAPVTVSVVASAQAQNVKRKPRECSRVSLPRWISNYISFRCLFLRFGRWMEFRSLPAQISLSEKRESKSTSRLKTNELNRQTKIYTSTSTERISSKSRCRSRRPQTCANSRALADENLFFFISCFLPQSLVSAPKDTQNEGDCTPEETKEKGTAYSLFAQYQRDCWIFFSN